MCDQECPEEVEEAAAMPSCAITQEGDQDTEREKKGTSMKNSIYEQKCGLFWVCFSFACMFSFMPHYHLVVISGLIPFVCLMPLNCTKCLDVSARWVSNSIVF